MIKAEMRCVKRINWCIFAAALLFFTNYLITPEIVGIIKLETYFRPKHQLPFDSNEWKASSPASGKRYKMVDNLFKRQILQGKSRLEILELLGNPNTATPEGGTEVQMLYALASQKDYPAHSFMFPGRLQNLEVWILLLRFRDGRVYLAQIIAT